MVKNLEGIQLNIPSAYHFDRFLLDKLRSACCGIRELETACHVRQNNASTFIRDVEAALTNLGQDKTTSSQLTVHTTSPLDSTNAIFYADSRFIGILAPGKRTWFSISESISITRPG